MKEPAFRTDVSCAVGRERAPAISEGGSLPSDLPCSLPELLQRTARTFPAKGITYVRTGEADKIQSYLALLAEGSRIASGLRDAGLHPGDKVLFQFNDNCDFVAAFWGCTLCGCVPVPISVARDYKEANAAVKRLLNAYKMFGSPLVLTNETLADSIRGLASLLDVPDLRVETVDNLRTSQSTGVPFLCKPDDACLILLTSGSTGMPKGVVLRHRNLISHCAGTAIMNHFTADDVWLNWLPLDHVAGLVMFHLHGLCLGSRQVHATTDAFLQRPLIWLDWIVQYRATVSWAPNFAFALVNAQSEPLLQGHWDLSAMRFIMNAGEMIVPETAARFMQLLSAHGLAPGAMRPAWGMSETSSAVTYSDSFASPTNAASPFVEDGRPIPGIAIRIVDSLGKLLTEGKTGRLQVRGASVHDGYYDNPTANMGSFVDGWFSTGDLAFLHDGAVTITGREKNTIIVNGINYYGHEIEGVVEGVDGVESSYVAVCAVRRASSQTDELAIFFTPTSASSDSLPSVFRRIREKVMCDIGLNPAHIIPLAKDSIPKTEIGKIQRSELKKRFEAGEFDALVLQLMASFRSGGRAPVLPRSSTESRIAEIWKQILQVDPVSIDDDFFDLGGHSLSAAQVISRIADQFAVSLSIRALFDAPTVSGLAQIVDNPSATVEDSLAKPCRTRTEGPVPLSPLQLRMWRMHEEIPSATHRFNVVFPLELRGPVDAGVLKQAVHEIARRHDVLRTTFPSVGGAPIQSVDPEPKINFRVVDLADSPEPGRAAGEVIRAEAQKPFSLTDYPPWRITLCHVGEESFIFNLTSHHILFDGSAVEIFSQELTALYNALAAGCPSPLAEPALQYRDFTIWQGQCTDSPLFAKQLDYWVQQLKQPISMLELPVDHPRPDRPSFGAAVEALEFNAKDTMAVRAIGRTERATPFMTVLAAFVTLLHLHTKETDVVIGIPIAKRLTPDMQQLLGLVADALVLRINLKDNPTFREVVRRVRETTLEAYANYDVPFELVVQRMNLETLPNRDRPLFQIVYAYENAPTILPRLSGIKAVPLQVHRGATRFDLVSWLVERENTMAGRIEYSTDIYDRETILRFVGDFKALVGAVAAHPEWRLSDLGLQLGSATKAVASSGAY